MGSPTEKYLQCTPAGNSPTESVIVGDSFTLKGSEPAHIEKITLADAKNLTVEQSYLIPYQDGESLVGGDSYPPTVTTSWHRREKARGAEVQPEELTSIALVLHRPNGEKVGTAEGLIVHYSVGTGRYTKQNSIAFQVQTDACE